MKRLAFPIAAALLGGAVLVAVPFASAVARPDRDSAEASSPRNPQRANRGAKAQVQNPYPNATREEPAVKVPAKIGKRLDRALKQLDEEKYDDAEPALSEIVADPASGAYAQAMAYQGLAYIATQRDDDIPKSLQFTRKALDLDALPNNTHFGALLQFANYSMGEDKYQDAITAIDQWLKQSGTEKDVAYIIKASSLYNLERLDEAADTIRKAIALAEKPNESAYQLLVASYLEQDKYPQAIAEGEAALNVMPGSKVLTRLLGSAYINAEQQDKAVALFSGAYERGMMTSEADIKLIYQLYNHGERPLEAIKIIQDGFASGRLPRNLDHVRALGDAYRIAEKSVEAAAAYGEAAKFASDGELNYLQAYMFYDAEKNAEAKAAVEEALRKSPFKSEGQAWILLGNCEIQLNNKAGAIAAFKKAAGFEATRGLAETWLKNASRM
jgi:predicted Zn-dependent protease